MGANMQHSVNSLYTSLVDVVDDNQVVADIARLCYGV